MHGTIVRGRAHPQGRARGIASCAPPPLPGPLRHSFVSLKTPGARSASLAWGRRGRTGGAAWVPPPPLGEGDRGRWESQVQTG